MTGSITTRMVRLTTPGEPEAMRLESIVLPPPGPGEILVRQTAMGFNFIDLFQRNGAVSLPLPTGLGQEAVGVVQAVGPGAATGFAPGDRVAYMNAGPGAYAMHRNVPAQRLVAVPEELADEQVAAVFFKAMTAQYLLRKTHRVERDDLLLVHAAAGGVGQILCGWARSLGAIVIGTVGAPAKCQAALDAGCEAVVDYSQPGWVQQVQAAMAGRKARVVYDSVGAHTLMGSLDCAAPFGLVVVYGNASGPAPAVEPELLNRKGCLFLTRPSVFPHNADPEVFRANAAEVFNAIASGAVKARIGARYRLADVAQAHRAAEQRSYTGALVLVP